MSDPKVQETQSWLNTTYGANSQWNHLDEDGQIGWQTIYGMIRGLKIELGITSLSDNFGDGTMAALTSQYPVISATTSSYNVRRLAQSALWCHGFQGGFQWGTFDTVTNNGVKSFMYNSGLVDLSASVPTDIKPKMLKALMTLDSYSLLSGGTAQIREAQQWINRKYLSRKQPLLPCDGIFTRSTQQGLMTVIQYEIGMTDAQANGNFGPGTKDGLRTQGNLAPGASDGAKNWVRLFQCALRMNGYNSPLNGSFDAGTVSATTAFQSYAELPGGGSANFQTWASLLISTSDETRPGIASDMATQLNAGHCAALYSNGYRTVGRYLSVLGKRYKALELDTIFNAGLKTFPIMQEANTSAGDFSFEAGRNHGDQALRRLRQLGFKPGNTVFFAVDFDPNDDTITSNVIPYFQGIKQRMDFSLKKYKVGIYGTRNVCRRVIEAGLADEAFIASMSWGWGGNLGYPLPPKWSYDQIWNGMLPSSSVVLELDKNVQSSWAKPAGRSDVLVTPTIKVPVIPGGTAYTQEFDEDYFWYISELMMRADMSSADRTQAWKIALYWIANQKYNSPAWQLYTPQDMSSGDTIALAHLGTQAPAIPSSTFDRFTHWAATIRGYLKHWNNTPSLGAGHAWFGDLGGWGFDLATAWDDYVNSGTSMSVRSWMAANIGYGSPSFGGDDLIEDVDGFLTAKMLRDNSDVDLDDCVRQIEVACMTDPNWRYQEFAERRFGGSVPEMAAAGAEIFTDDLYWALAMNFVSAARPSSANATQIGLGFADAIKAKAGL